MSLKDPLLDIKADQVHDEGQGPHEVKDYDEVQIQDD